jgi:hypothetical protein
MLVKDMRKLPKTAGEAKLHFSSHPVYELPAPSRLDDWITLPYTDTSQFQPIKGGDQFLFYNLGGPVAFGGTDERPFLVGLHSDARKAFEESGEEGLFEFIKPPEIRQLESEHGCGLTRRQGDIFAYPKLKSDGRPMTMTEAVLEELTADPRVRRGWLGENYTGYWQVFGTRHLLDGRRVEFERRRIWDSSRTEVALTLAEGTIYAPDHAPLTIEGPHVLAQTVGLSPMVDSRLID